MLNEQIGSQIETSDSFNQQDHLQVIDALRGYAILLVIAVHSLGQNKDLVWPMVRPLLLGFYGVQLFFMASALTLLMSWHRSNDGFSRRSYKFMVRRFFRIAPFYYLAIIVYWFAYQVKPDDFSFDVLLASLLFYNAWSPYLIPTVPGWTPVPGGWSIGVEFCFYFLFPILAIVVTTLWRSIVFFLLSLLLMVVAANWGGAMYPELMVEQRSNFLYFWPPNQLVIFSLGFVLFYSVTNTSVKEWLERSNVTSNKASIGLCVVLFALSFYGPRKFFDWSSGLPPTHFIVSILFLMWAIVLIVKPGGFVVNSAISGLGKVSFSAYILHFAILKYTGVLFMVIWPFGYQGWASIPYSLLLIVFAVLLTRYVSGLSYRFIEAPGIRFGKTFVF